MFCFVLFCLVVGGGGAGGSGVGVGVGVGVVVVVVGGGGFLRQDFSYPRLLLNSLSFFFCLLCLTAKHH